MEIRHLRYFVRIVELRSFAKAASELHVAQSGLGIHVRNLEDELKVKLVDRHSRGIEPTEAGRLLYDRATKIIRELEQAKLEIAAVANPLRGRIVLGCSPTVERLITAVLAKRRDALAQINWNLVNGAGEALVEQVRTGQIDLCCTYDVDETHGCLRRELFYDELVFVKHRQPHEAARATISFAELASQPLTLPPIPYRVRRRLETTAAQQGVDLNVAFEVHSVSGMREMAEQNLAGAILPFGSVARDVANKNLVIRRIVDPILTQTLWIYRSGARPISPAEAALQTVLHDALVAEITSAKEIWERSVANTRARSKVRPPLHRRRAAAAAARH